MLAQAPLGKPIPHRTSPGVPGEHGGTPCSARVARRTTRNSGTGSEALSVSAVLADDTPIILLAPPLPRGCVMAGGVSIQAHVHALTNVTVWNGHLQMLPRVHSEADAMHWPTAVSRCDPSAIQVCVRTVPMCRVPKGIPPGQGNAVVGLQECSGPTGCHRRHSATSTSHTSTAQRGTQRVADGLQIP